MAVLNTNVPMLSEDAAQKLLNNVFDACDQTPNTVPLDKLTSYSEYRRERYSLQKIVLIIIFLLFMALPFCFVLPHFTTEKVSPDDARIPKYAIRVLSGFPLSRVTADVDGHNVTVYETGDRTYAVEPTVNGLMTIRVTNINHQYALEQIMITGIDNDPPDMTGNEKKGDRLYIYVTDAGTGINYDGAYAEYMSGKVLRPVECGDGYVAFDYPSESVNIYIPDNKENVLHLVVSLG